MQTIRLGEDDGHKTQAGVTPGPSGGGGGHDAQLKTPPAEKEELPLHLLLRLGPVQHLQKCAGGCRGQEY